MIVRRARPDDVRAILRLIRALATYEYAPDSVEATEEMLHESLFAVDAKVFGHVVEFDGEVAGIAIWFLNYSTWTGRPGIYLEDLFVEESARGTGAGKALFQALAREAIAKNCARIDWAVLDWNRTAMDFYTAIGGRRQTGWEPWRLDRAGIEALAR